MLFSRKNLIVYYCYPYILFYTKNEIPRHIFMRYRGKTENSVYLCHQTYIGHCVSH